MSRVSLTKDFFVRHFNDEKSQKIDTFTGIELVSCWSLPFSIEKGVTFGDLLRLLKTADPSLITFIAMATDCNLEPFLKDVRPRIDDGDSLEAIEIARYYELSNYDDVNMFVMNAENYCSGIGRDENGGEINYAIEFTPWKELEPLPLIISNKSKLTKLTWAECEPKPLEWITTTGVEIPGKTEREFVSSEMSEILSTDITLGEFFSCLLNELCFFGSPSRAESKMNELTTSLQEVTSDLEEAERKKKREIN